MYVLSSFIIQLWMGKAIWKVSQIGRDRRRNREKRRLVGASSRGKTVNDQLWRVSCISTLKLGARSNYTKPDEWDEYYYVFIILLLPLHVCKYLHFRRFFYGRKADSFFLFFLCRFFLKGCTISVRRVDFAWQASIHFAWMPSKPFSCIYLPTNTGHDAYYT